MKKLYLWFYCLKFTDVALLILVGTVFFAWLQWKYGSRRFWKPGLGAALLLWLLAVVWSTLLSRGAEPMSEPASWMPLHSYWAVLHGANIELLRANFMNVVLLYPAGLLAASLLPQRKKQLQTAAGIAAIFFLLSLCIELWQYRFALGYPETDDILHNTLGAFLGAWAAKLTRQFHKIMD